MLNKAALFLVYGLALSLSTAEAVELGQGVQAHGFLSQSLVHTSDNRLGGRSDDGMAADMREIGGNLSWRPSADWLLSGQALVRWAGESDAGDVRLDYGFVDRTLLTSSASSLGVRVGKIKNPYGFFNTTRDVAKTRPGIIMPQSVYMDRVRNFFLAAPGIGFYGNHENANGNLAWQISALRPEVNDPDLTYFMLGTLARGHFEGKDSWLGQAMFESEGGRWRAGLSLGEMAMKYHRGAGDPFAAGQSRVPTWVVSLEHNTEHWSLTTEYAQNSGHSRGYNIPIVEQDNVTEAWYAQLTRRFGEGWQGFLRYDAFFADKNDRAGSLFSPSYMRFAKDWSVGVRRDVGRWAWSGEWHHVDGTAWLSPTDTPIGVSVRKWDMLLLQGAWYF
ncbi:MAG: hypothetical protein PHD37_02430 [Gallionellaceae bacterium]|nr:hypothetical protein [Gallionellaceae bacterium]